MTARNLYPVPPVNGGGRSTGHTGRGRPLPTLASLIALLLIVIGVLPVRVLGELSPPGRTAFSGSLLPYPAQQEAEQDLLSIGVIDLDAEGVEDTEARAITGRLRIWLGRTGVFQVIERNQMESIMEEMGFQFSGACDTDECVVQVGRILGASKMVAGSVAKVGTLYSLQIRIIDITTSRIEHTSFKDEERGIEYVMREATQAVADELALFVRGGQVVQPAQPSTEPARPAAGRLTTASVRVESNPPGATITHEGTGLGTTPATITLPEGTQQLVFELANYRPLAHPIEVVAGRDQEVTVRLEAIPTGNLNLVTDPAQCEVFIDGESVGRSPLQRRRVLEGVHQIEVRRDGYDTQTRQITISPRQTTTEEFTLRRSGSAQITFHSTLNGGRLSITGDEEESAVLANPEQAVTIPPGEYTLLVKAKGYAPWRHQITLGNGADEIVPVTLRPKSRVVAGLLSVIPGMGQFYSGRGMMGVLYLGGVAGAAAATFSQQGAYNDLKQDYEDLQAEYDAATTTAEIDRLHGELADKHTEMQDAWDGMNSTATIMMAVWAVNLLDAAALMPRLRPFGPGVQTDLNLGVRANRLCFTLTLGF